MFKNPLVSYQFWVLLIFVLLEGALFSVSNSIKSLVAVSEYCFVIVAFFKNRQVGILYFFSFIVLTVGWGNYFGEVEFPSNFWGLRFGYSFSILVTVFFSLVLLFENSFRLYVYSSNTYFLFIILFIAYTFFMGFIRVVQELNYLDNFVDDILIYCPVLFYMILLSKITNENIFLLIKYVIPLSIILMIVSVITDNRLDYSGNFFALTNSLSLILPFAVIMMKSYYNFKCWLLMVCALVYLFITNEFFISGKFIIIFFIFLLWLTTRSKKGAIIFLVPIVLIILNLDLFFDFFLVVFEDNSTVSFKFSQINDAMSLLSDPFFIASIHSSIGNVIAEFLTLMRHLKENLFFLFLGKGFGGGIPDYWGFLTPFAGGSGYSAICAVRNDFVKLHLPIYDVLLKGGFFFFLYYVIIFIKSFKNKSIFGFLFAISLFTIFIVTKEMMLFTLLLIRLFSEKENIQLS